jgi:hypothetical protein
MTLSFHELLAVHMKHTGEKGAVYLFESVRKRVRRRSRVLECAISNVSGLSEAKTCFGSAS